MSAPDPFEKRERDREFARWWKLQRLGQPGLPREALREQEIAAALVLPSVPADSQAPGQSNQRVKAEECHGTNSGASELT